MPTKTARPKIVKIRGHQVYRKRPGSSKLITRSRYMADIKQRWAIHRFEVRCLIDDISSAVTFIKPYHAKLVNMIK